MVVLLAPYYQKFAKNPQLHAFVQGVTAAAVAAIAGAVFVLGRSSVRDLPTAVIAIVSLLVLMRWKVPKPLIIGVAGILRLILRH